MTKLNRIEHYIRKENYSLMFRMTLFFLVTALLGVFISVALSQYERCVQLEKRVRDLNDVFAREVILESYSTLRFELSRLEKEVGWGRLTFNRNSLQNEGCSPLNFKQKKNIPIYFSNNVIGNVEAYVSHKIDFNLILLYVLPIFVSILSLMSLISRYRKNLVLKIVKPVEEFSNQSFHLDEFSAGKRFSYQGDLVELADLKHDLNLMLDRLVDVHNENIELHEYRGVADLASKVAHDIRSPLASLYMVTRNVSSLSESERLLIRNSVNRIQDITNDLLSKNVKHRPGNGTDEWLVAGAIDEIVSEKRNKFRSSNHIYINFELDVSSYEIASIVDQISFKRVLSNIIDNSVESIDKNSGIVNIKLLTTGLESWSVEISDNGRGIPSHLLSDLGNKKVSFDKAGGTGLGLLSSRSFIKSVNGEFKIESVESEGTKVTIVFPLSVPPKWFCRELYLSGGMEVIILDDDISIHDVWRRRFSWIAPDRIHFFTSTKKLLDFIGIKGSNYLFLVDYEIIGDEMNGIDLIKTIGDFKNTILVTSRFDDREVVEACIESDISMIPKSLAEFVPITEISEAYYRQRKCILLEDDKYLSLGWIDSARKNNVDLIVFSTVESLMAGLVNIPLDSIFFIDNNILGDEVFFKVYNALYVKGYKNCISISSSISSTKNIRHLNSKVPPWEILV